MSACDICGVLRNPLSKSNRDNKTGIKCILNLCELLCEFLIFYFLGVLCDKDIPLPKPSSLFIYIYKKILHVFVGLGKDTVLNLILYDIALWVDLIFFKEQFVC